MIETIVVLVILGLALGIVAGFLPRRNTTLELTAATSRVAGALRLARSRAMVEGHPVPFAAVPGGHGFRLDDTQVNFGPSVTVVMAEPRILFAPDGSTSGGSLRILVGGKTACASGGLVDRLRCRRRSVVSSFGHGTPVSPGKSGQEPRRAATPHPIQRAGSSGFTLLEVLIAFAIASIALAVLYRGATDGLLGSRLAARTDEAVARARSRLAALCYGAPLAPGEQSGEDGSGYTWRTQIIRAATETVARGGEDQPSPPLRADLFAVRVTMLWPGAARPHEVSLETRCLSVGPGDRP